MRRALKNYYGKGLFSAFQKALHFIWNQAKLKMLSLYFITLSEVVWTRLSLSEPDRKQASQIWRSKVFGEAIFLVVKRIFIKAPS